MDRNARPGHQAGRETHHEAARPEFCRNCGAPIRRLRPGGEGYDPQEFTWTHDGGVLCDMILIAEPHDPAGP